MIFVASLMACNFHIAQTCPVLSCPIQFTRNYDFITDKSAANHGMKPKPKCIVTAVVHDTNHNKRDINKFMVNDLCNILKISSIHDLVRFDSEKTTAEATCCCTLARCIHDTCLSSALKIACNKYIL